MTETPVQTQAAPRTATAQVPYWIPLAVILVPAALLTVGSLLWPEIFWEKFVDKYYWTPIVEDTGYNLVNTASWAILLGALLFVMNRFLADMHESMDVGLALAAVPYMAWGSVVRVLEDTKMFDEPFRYLLITPQIYVAITLLASLVFVYGHHLNRASKVLGVRVAAQELAAAYGLLFVAYLLMWRNRWDEVRAYANPLILAASLGVAWFWVYRHARFKGEMSPRVVTGATGVALFLFAAWYVLQWIAGVQWPSLSNTDETNPWVLVVLVAGPLLVVFFVRSFALRLAETRPNAAVFAHPLNLLVVFAQVSDGLMTTLGIDFYGYSEKHVATRALLELAGGVELPYPTAMTFLPLKLLLALGVIYAIDIYSKEDVKKHPNLVGVAKLAIVVVGLSPGIRDGVRLAMGV